eukprot:TRINITY_DN49095_c0_g1_i1.p1 TRINITY_DN49095_c0_g1~~TRINITY_DN49095_c0_g1_i1.p1  ORF type:complete len:106 (-),score=8.45 TRINITY_DN49095_c0_g1_i1:2-319(-)
MKGTTSAGRRHKRNHTLCKRCGKHAYHNQKHQCASCGYPEARIRHHNWGFKAQRRRTTGTGRCQHLREVQRRFKNAFQEGSQAPRLKNNKNKRLREEREKKEQKQ